MPVDVLFKTLREQSLNRGVTDLTALLAGTSQQYDHASAGFEVHRIGDAVSSRNVHAAIYDALRLCVTL